MSEPSSLLTVVTIGRNNLEDLRLTIDSVQGQTFGQLRQVVIDGASTDGTVAFLESTADGERLSWMSEPDHGIYDAMNKANALVHDGYLMFLHAGDSFVDERAAERAMTAIDQAPTPVDIAIGWSRFVASGERLAYVVGAATPKALTSAHESTIFSNAFHQTVQYNTDLRLAADYEFFRILAARDDLTVLRLGFTISHFAFGGRSNDPAFDGPRFLERARIDAGFGEAPTASTYLKIGGRMAARRLIYGVFGADRAARIFLRLACRRGNSGARHLPIDQVQVHP